MKSDCLASLRNLIKNYSKGTPGCEPARANIWLVFMIPAPLYADGYLTEGFKVLKN